MKKISIETRDLMITPLELTISENNVLIVKTPLMLKNIDVTNANFQTNKNGNQEKYYYKRGTYKGLIFH